ncbi:MAG: lipoate--protein ligase [Treponema sp.]|jgi:lipoate-protein ligase A|nr:lipoate--protein ligase [Treponema sp.]
MIERIFTVTSNETNPYRNIALEALLFECVERGVCILYLWQNRHTVVIGRNQNAWKECRVEDLEASGGFLARRLSGGGAVYHDLGNLNFTFLLPKDDYDTEKQSAVILRAVQMAGIDAYRSGRNDIETEGRKFSGNAFYFSGNNAYHHGTLLVNADLNAASQYLTVQAGKIKAKGVESVRKRMINLAECKQDLTIPALQQFLIAAFDEVYGLAGSPLDKGMLDQERLSALEAKFGDPEWKYGKNPPFQFETGARFAWGDIDIRIDISENRINSSRFFSDAMDESFILSLSPILAGVSFTRPAVQAALKTAFAESPQRLAYCDDILGLIFDAETQSR